MKLCACGCRKPVANERNTYLHGHWAKTSEGRAKLSTVNSGENNPRDFLGKHHSERTRATLSELRKGKAYEEIYGEERAKEIKVKVSPKGKPHYGMSGKLVGNKNPMRRPEVGKKVGRALKGKRMSWMEGENSPTKRPEVREKIRLTVMERHKDSKYKKRRIEGIKRAHSKPEYRKKISEALKGKKNPWNRGEKNVAKRPGVRVLLSKKAKKQFEAPSQRELRSFLMTKNLRKGIMRKRPTTTELKFTGICQKYSLPFKYVGNSKFWIENMNPDFVECNGKKVAIEILGDYWHNEEEFKKRKDKFAEYGWKVIGIWEHELRNLSEEEIVRMTQSAYNK